MEGDGFKEWDFWKPLVVTSAAYSVIAFLFGRSFAGGGVFGLFVAFALSQVTGIFAALGPGSYLKRLAVTQACNAVFWFSLFGGIITSFGTPPRMRDFTIGLFSVAAIISAAPQIVYGFFRVVFGWRFLKRGMARGAAYDLKDLFVLTLFASIVFAPASLSLNISDSREDAGLILVSVFSGVLIGTLVYGIPTAATVFKTRNINRGCAMQFMIVISISLLTAILPPLLGARVVFSPMPTLLVGCGILLVGCGIFTWLPLTIMRQNGFILSTGNENVAAAEFVKTCDD